MPMGKIIRLSFTGDVMCYEEQKNVARKNGYFDFNPVFVGVKETLKNVDYLCGNLETPIVCSREKSSAARFFSPPAFLDALKQVGFKFFSLANNHALDAGEKGILSTIKAMEDRQLAYAGVCADERCANEILVRDVNGVKIAFLSYTYGANSEHHKIILDAKKMYMLNLIRKQPLEINYERPPSKSIFYRGIRKILRKIGAWPKDINCGLEPVLDNASACDIANEESNALVDNMKKQIERAKKKSDLVVMCLHIGGQYNSILGTYTKYIFDQLNKTDVDLVIGNHPHCILSYKYSKKFFAYSLGNFSYTPGSPWEIKDVYADYSILLNFWIDSETKKIRNVSCQLLVVKTDDSGYSCTYSAYERLLSEHDSKIRKKLEVEYRKAVERFLGHKVKHIEAEYFVEKN